MKVLNEVRHQIDHMREAMRHVLRPAIRVRLATVLVDANTLAGWQSLDLGLTTAAWEHYDAARLAAREAESPGLYAYACAAQSVVLVDIGDASGAVELTEHANKIGKCEAPPLLRAWLAAAHGEAAAAKGRARESMEAFDEADRTMPDEPDPAETPYLVFGRTHLARWRGNALARLDSQSAVDVLSRALAQLDPSFTRAEVAVRADLARAFATTGERAAAREQAAKARELAEQIGSIRHRRRLAALTI
ncbi:hypothetical protein LX15_005983 [Streptoalloteichus tenebrarius]|uniref:Uncharacterized protein n=1 Tax=Streptoalloteichus tenebrarius (strain ATCC 17920 / DSM 40477 / JCM 4838 / CBS 697.72 / NBRC 16177 / NCIMB 11028 / NRRL B-12390 / A12253. 1 / ISP 5477) TaxID=1933 RepID=A0ABT1I3B3_STRSD|nr:tetratricopeptide repeat protein [Streptoalloteichus tenebrarius]MCP2262249.1 hypothetical protein [Streptoalloteichus tenebrarius]BFF00771.1 hypothetical protein GCM10020241_24460 [Streptoalloteichus tenebrarius]